MSKLPFCLLLFQVHILYAQQTTVKVHAGDHTRASAPVFVKLQEAGDITRNYFLVNTSSKRKLPAQLVDSITLVFICDTIMSGTANSYLLQKSGLKTGNHLISTKRKNDGILLQVRNKPVLFYHTEKAQPPPDSPRYYQRSGFIHPLYSPEGKTLTDDFPVRHTHQHGIFQAWVNTTFRGKPVDFWNQHKQTGTVEHAALIGINSGQVLTELKCRLKHISLLHGEVLSEILTIRVYPYSDHFILDIHSEQENITGDTLILNQYHYGGMAFRGSRVWSPDDSEHYQSKWKITTSEGLEDTSADQSKAKWVDASGVIDGTMAGVAVFDHPSNYRYPQAIRVHPRMPYWCYVPVTAETINILPGDVFRSRYRYLVYHGNVPVQLIKRVQMDWAAPPAIDVIQR